jgi:hypothetical protein
VGQTSGTAVAGAGLPKLVMLHSNSPSVSFAKTPGRLNFIHATCYTASLDVIDFKCAPNFGEAQDRNVHRGFDEIAAGLQQTLLTVRSSADSLERQKRPFRIAGQWHALPLRVFASQRGAFKKSPGGLPFLSHPLRFTWGDASYIATHPLPSPAALGALTSPTIACPPLCT